MWDIRGLRERGIRGCWNRDVHTALYCRFFYHRMTKKFFRVPWKHQCIHPFSWRLRRFCVNNKQHFLLAYKESNGGDYGCNSKDEVMGPVRDLSSIGGTNETHRILLEQRVSVGFAVSEEKSVQIAGLYDSWIYLANGQFLFTCQEIHK